MRSFCGLGFYLHGEIIWHTHNREHLAAEVYRLSGLYPGRAPVLLHDFEFILVFCRAETLRDRGAGSIRRLPCCPAVWRIPWSYHGDPPPMAPRCVRRLIDLFTTEGDLVFDPFMGTGTTAVEALRSGRRFLGCELNPETHQRCERRLKRFMAKRPRF